MQLRQLFKDDDAVSPVIGVILMVAITVILAAVIASFVLGLGDTADEVQPTSSFSLDDVDGDDETVTITLTDGDTVDFEEIVLRGSVLTEEVPFTDEDVVDDPDEEWNVGQSLTIEDGDSEDVDISEAENDPNWDSPGELRIVWEESGGDNSATLAEFDIEF